MGKMLGFNSRKEMIDFMNETDETYDKAHYDVIESALEAVSATIMFVEACPSIDPVEFVQKLVRTCMLELVMYQRELNRLVAHLQYVCSLDRLGKLIVFGCSD